LRPRLTTGLPFSLAHRCARLCPLSQMPNKSAIDYEQMRVLSELGPSYGNPTIDFSVASVTLVSVPAPPFSESLPLTISWLLSASLPS
jgi:hypothetical protein